MTKVPNNKPQVKELEDKLAWVYLFNLIFYFIPMFVSPMTTSDIIISLIALVAFFPLYFKLHRASSKSYQPLSLLFLLSVAVTPFNSGSLAFFTFTAFFAGFRYPIKTSLLLWLGQIATIWLLNWFLYSSVLYFALWGTFLTICIGMIGMATRQRELSLIQKQQSTDEIKTLATIVERERIARDLHDVMGHSLSSITLKAELASKLIDNQQYELAKQHLDELAEISRDNLSQLRQTVSNYKHKGLATTVTELCQRIRDKGMTVELTGELPNQLSAGQESHLCLMLTELTNNMLKHSTGKTCYFTFDTTKYGYNISITEAQALTSITEGNGLKGIRERLEDIGGEFSYQLTPELTFTVQLPKADNND